MNLAGSNQLRISGEVMCRGRTRVLGSPGQAGPNKVEAKLSDAGTDQTMSKSSADQQRRIEIITSRPLAHRRGNESDQQTSPSA